MENRVTTTNNNNNTATPTTTQVKPIGDYEGQQQKMRDDIAFAQVAFSEQAIAIMTTRPGDHDGAGAGAGAGGWRSSGGGGAVGGGESWDRRLARPENFLQLCRDDTCGKMRTLKVHTNLLYMHTIATAVQGKHTIR